jgi:thiamine-monophosphate kinase
MAETEQQMIGRLLAPLSDGLVGAFGLTDDAAALAPEDGCEFVVTMDTLIDGVHFLFNADPQLAAAAAHKALAVNVSDLAAKAAEPYAYLLSLSLPDGYEAWLETFVTRLAECQHDWGLSLAGGDTVRTTGPLSVSITAIGNVPAGKMVRRSTASAGDVLVVSGTIGDAFCGLQAILDPPASRQWHALIGDNGLAELVARSREPQPRVQLITALRNYATCALDISDGLALDASRLAAASGLAAEIEAESVPISHPVAALVANGAISLEQLITGGDDYEILAAVSPQDVAAYVGEAASRGLKVQAIGRLKEGNGLRLHNSAGDELPLSKLGFDHLG